MNTWETLKIGVAATGTAVVLIVIHGITELVFPESYVTKAGYKVPGVTEQPVDLASLQRTWPAGLRQQGGRVNVRDYMANIEKVSIPRSAEAPPALAAPQPEVDLGTRLAASDPAKGKQTAQACTSCHSFDQGQDRVGPSLWGVVGRGIASDRAFTYSSAFAAQTGAWTYERLDHYLTNPAKAIPGNKMGFAGIRNAQDRANVIAFLSTLGASRPPFPKPEQPKAVESPSQGAGDARAGREGSGSEAKGGAKAALALSSAAGLAPPQVSSR